MGYDKKEEEKIRVTQNAMKRSMLGVKLEDKIKIEHIKKKLNKNKDILKTIRKLKWDWAGHVCSQTTK